MLSNVTFGDVFAKRSAWRVLAALLEPPFVPHQQRELALTLRVAEPSVQRGLRALVGAGLVQRKRRQYAVSVGQDAVRYLWLLRQVERQSALPPDLANGLSVLLARDFRPDDCVIVFGSWARGVAVPGESDVDVAVFTAQSTGTVSKRVFEGPYRFEIQFMEMKELQQPSNSVALDALLNGIPITRRESVYDALLNLRSFPKSFLVYRLRQADKLVLRTELAEGDVEAAKFFSGAAERIIGQVRNILEHGRTLSWRETARAASAREAIKDLEERLAREGDRIWLT
jgi:predicted nucleotidyltransferase